MSSSPDDAEVSSSTVVGNPDSSAISTIINSVDVLTVDSSTIETVVAEVAVTEADMVARVARLIDGELHERLAEEVQARLQDTTVDAEDPDSSQHSVNERLPMASEEKGGIFCGFQRNGVIVVSVLLFIGCVVGVSVALAGQGGKTEKELASQPSSSIPTLNPSIVPTVFPSLYPSSAPSLSRRSYLRETLGHRIAPNATADGWALFEDESTPQGQALRWMSEDDIFSSQPQSLQERVLLDRYALAVLYFACSGPSWNIQFPFLDSTTSVCEWNNGYSFVENVFQAKGVYCTDLNETNLVRVLFLQDSDLRSTLPWEIALLTNLETLNLANNSLSGTLPRQLVDLGKLSFLFLHENSLSGQAVPSLPSGVRQLILRNNKFSFRLPSEWGDSLPYLEILRISGNSLTGSIPAEWGKLQYLSSLDISGNGITGSLPSSIGSMKNLTEVYLEYNSITGTLPAEIGGIRGLAQFFCPFNILSGSIPSEITYLSDLQYLDLKGNVLTGQIPAHLPPSLVGMILDDNILSGTLASEWGSLSDLLYISIATNHVHGSIPSEWGNFRNLQTLNVGNNFLSSSIPKALCDVASLQYMSMYNSTITGTIPTELGLLSNLLILLLQYNSLEGSIPSEVSQLTKLTELHLDHNLLSGSMPITLAPNLEILIVSDNSITGMLHSEWPNSMPSMTYLDLDNNRFQGSIPQEWGNFQRLEYLKVVENNLNGTIPSEIGMLTDLNILALQGNVLSGGLPSEIGLLTLMTVIDVENNVLITGTIPEEYRNMIRLQYFWFSNTSLTGSVDDIFCGDYYIPSRVMMADCKGSNPEIECSCCYKCCTRGGLFCTLQ